MPPISFIAGIFATLAAATAQPPVQPGEIRTFRDWSVGCDNSGNCQAVSLVPDEGGAGFDDWDGPISIVRTAGSDDIFRSAFCFSPETWTVTG
ncbi:hypothetical protein C8024_16325 [Sphingopyxis sp. BSNA05]|uniref:hypothetical protein n=1 Tax=Sphingopyxis sp. BSNA05 TaxID=1236614 RepID=UPI001563BB9B|nr:hypothetical protein [Sphingopyxis sp. BSNA05]NRD90676.1 hypothetical protein [Sphingopyxis sp. BSNA05]